MKSWEEINEAGRRVANAESKSIRDLALLAGLDPLKHFGGLDLRGTDFSGQNLSGFDFRGSQLDGSLFKGAILGSAVFDGQQISLPELREALDWASATSPSARIVPYLSSLRRYARAFYGSEDIGASAVAGIVNVIDEEVSSFPTDGTEEVALFRLFTTLFMNQSRYESFNREISVGRKYFILYYVENFTKNKIAEILSLSLDALDDIAYKVDKTILDNISVDVLYINSRNGIAFLAGRLEKMGMRTIGISHHKLSAINTYKKHRPYLIVADVSEYENLMMLKTLSKFKRSKLIAFSRKKFSSEYGDLQIKANPDMSEVVDIILRFVFFSKRSSYFENWSLEEMNFIADNASFANYRPRLAEDDWMISTISTSNLARPF